MLISYYKSGLMLDEGFHKTGPGYHDDAWELGRDYPPVFMQWTTRTNLEVCMDLVRYGNVNVNALTTHYIDLLDAEKQIDEITDPEEILGLVFVNGGIRNE